MLLVYHLTRALEGSSGGMACTHAAFIVFFTLSSTNWRNTALRLRRRPARLGPRADYRGCSRQTSRPDLAGALQPLGRDALQFVGEEERDQGEGAPCPASIKEGRHPRSRKTRKYRGCRRRCRRCPRRSRRRRARARGNTRPARKTPGPADAPVPPGFVRP